MRNIISLCAVTLISLAVVTGFPNYPNRIPNGNRVPHPCKPNYLWYGVGHVNSKGGGARNKFGEDFKAWGYEWNICLCQEDSDGDGKTNGEELGDPDCVWTPGKVPQITTGITHPGVCDPFYGQECEGQIDWVDCSSSSDFKCDAMEAPGVKNFTIRFDKTKVPAKETTYICQAFNLTSMLPSGDSHLIGSTASLDNRNVMHHAIIYACPDANGATVLKNYTKPVECGMATQYCTDMIALWTVGVDGTCLNDQMGFDMGKNGYKIVLMEFHWNNPDLIDTYYDASGLTLYVTPNKRQYDAGVWFIGPPSVFIPPNMTSYSNLGGCSSACTNLMLDNSIYITRIVPHMHYLGTAFRFQQYRNGQMIYDLEVRPYMYDDPQVEVLENPLEVRPNDELKMECIFQSRERKTVTFFGESTQAEMCLAIITYYPYVNELTTCLTNDGYGFCNNTLYPNTFKDQGGSSECNITAFYVILYADGHAIDSNCDKNGLICYEGCKTALQRVMNHPCMTGKAKSTVIASFAYSGEGKELLKKIASCEERPPVVVEGGSGSSKCELQPPVSTGQKQVSDCGAILLIMLANLLHLYY